jgi:hypothetical protein
MLEESKPLRRATVATGPAFFEALIRDREKPPSTVAPVSAEVRRPPGPTVAALKLHRDVKWTLDMREMAERLCRFLDATSTPGIHLNQPIGSPPERAEPPHEPERTTEPSRSAELQMRAMGGARPRPVAVPPWGKPIDRPPPPERLVQRLAAALASPRPWQRIVDPERARGYFEGRARRWLATANDPLAVVEREERAAERFSIPGPAQPSSDRHGKACFPE